MTGEILDNAYALPNLVIPPFTEAEIQTMGGVVAPPSESLPVFRPSRYLMDQIKRAEAVVFEADSPVKPAQINYDEQLSELLEADIWTSSETHQDIRAYKIRGAYNFTRGLRSSERKKGMITASAGNHAQGIALAARILDTRAVVYMPETTPKLKIDRVRELGGSAVDIVIEGSNVTETLNIAQEVGRRNGMVFAPPFDDIRVMAGQGTWGMEIADRFEGMDLGYVFCPVGGYGLFSGMGTALRFRMPSTKLIAVEPEGAASFEAALRHGAAIEIGETDTHVDGAAVKKIGYKPFLLGKTLADGTIAPSNEEVNMATTYLWERSIDPIRAELAGALSVAGLFKYREILKKQAEKQGKKPKALVLITGGNLSEERYLSDVKREDWRKLLAA